MTPEIRIAGNRLASPSIRTNRYQSDARRAQLMQRRMLKEQAISRLQREIAEIDRLLYEVEN